MKVFFVLRVIDVNYAPLAAKKAFVALDGGPATPMVPTAQVGVFELELPPGTSKLEAQVTEDNFWPATQKLTVQQAPPLPTIAWDGAQEVNSRNVEAHSRGADANVVLHLVLGQVKDARAEVDAVTPKIASLSPLAADIRDLQASILNPGSSGWNRLRHSVKSNQTPDGQMFFVQRLSAPKLVAIYCPPRMFQTFQRENRPPEGVPIPYHVFFHPSTGAFKGSYPFSFAFTDLMARYVLYPQMWNVGKAMANQHFVSGKRCIFVFPVGSPTQSFGKITRQSDLLRLFQEINYWLQRMNRISFPINPVGHCAVSGFSAGCAAVRHVLESTFKKFDEDHLREVYGLDLYHPGDVEALCDTIRHWFRRGADDRKLRIYTQSSAWFSNLRDLLPKPTVTKGPSNAVEEETSSSTLAFMPFSNFWSDMNSEVPATGAEADFNNVPPHWGAVHQIIPALFMEHALKLSTFTDT